MGWLDTILGAGLNYGLGLLGQEIFGETGPSAEEAALGQAVAKTAEGTMKQNQESAYEAEKKRKQAYAQSLQIPQIQSPTGPSRSDTGSRPWLTNQRKAWEE